MGVKKENIIFDSSRDTFLALYLFKRPSPWGYRIEILYDIGKKDLFDIGTIEYMLWEPIVSNNKIIDIKENNCFSLVGGFGLERILMILNKYNHIEKVNHIKELYEEIIKDAKTKDKHKAFILTESIRVIHRIFTDSNGFFKLSRQRKRKVVRYLQAIYETLKNLKIPMVEIKKYLKINAKSNHFYPELEKNINLVNQEILDYFERKNNSK